MTAIKKTEYDWGYMIWWLDGENENAPDISVAKMVVNSNAKSELHYHNNCHEFILVNSGEVDVFLDNIPNTLRKNETILIPPNVRHYVKNSTKHEADLTIVYSAAKRHYSYG